MYPSLLLAYLGQGAALITNGEQVIQNVFYRSIPGGLNGPLFWSVLNPSANFHLPTQTTLQDRVYLCHSGHGMLILHLSLNVLIT